MQRFGPGPAARPNSGHLTREQKWALVQKSNTQAAGRKAPITVRLPPPRMQASPAAPNLMMQPRKSFDFEARGDPRDGGTGWETANKLYTPPPGPKPQTPLGEDEFDEESMRRDEEYQMQIANASHHQRKLQPMDDEEITPELESMNRHWARVMKAQAQADGPHIRQHFEKMRTWDEITSVSKQGLGLTSGLQRNTPFVY